MERILRVTNFLLGVIAVCLLLIVAKVYGVDVPRKAQAQVQGVGKQQPVYLVYWPDEVNGYQRVIGPTGVVRTSK
jgi:hypothetical protein